MTRTYLRIILSLRLRHLHLLLLLLMHLRRRRSARLTTLLGTGEWTWRSTSVGVTSHSLAFRRRVAALVTGTTRLISNQLVRDPVE